MFDIVVYKAHYNSKLDRVLRAFAAGIPGHVNATMGDLRKPKKSKYAVIFGLVKKTYKPTHLKKAVIDLVGLKNVIVLESAFLKRKKYWAAGFGGIHGGADFRAEGKPLDRWKLLDIEPKPWQRRIDGPMVVCGQLPRDTNVQHFDYISWCQETVEYYRSRRIPVVFRPHPRINEPNVYGIPESLFDTNPKLATTLQTARAVVLWNSTSGIDAMLQGVPVIAMGKDALSAPIASTDLDPGKLVYPDRTPLLAKIGYAQWTLNEMLSGKTWKHLMGD